MPVFGPRHTIPVVLVRRTKRPRIELDPGEKPVLRKVQPV